MKRAVTVMAMVCLCLALGCGNKKDEGAKQKPASPPVAEPKDEPPPPAKKELQISFGEAAETAAPVEEIQNRIKAASDELTACFAGTEATKANVNVVIGKTGAVDSVTPSADRERAEECLREGLGGLQFPAWEGDAVSVRVELRYVEAGAGEPPGDEADDSAGDTAAE